MPQTFKPIKLVYLLIGITSALAMQAQRSQPLQAQETDLETLCRLFPLNSRCQGTPPPPRREVPREPAPSPPTRPVPPAPVPPSEPTPPSPPRTIRLEEERSGIGVIGTGGTLGLGANVTGRILPNLNARIGYNGLSFSADFEESGIDYNTDVDLRTIPALVDYYPIENQGFRFTGGLVFNGNQATGSGEPTTINGVEAYEIGNSTFLAAEVGTLEAEVDFPDFAPYIGVGWGNPVTPGKRWGFFVDLGVMFQRSPEVNLTATGGAGSPGLQTELQREEEDLQEDLDGFRFYPVLQIGVTYQF
ncbi:hypothetical protein [Phormidium sp. CCY1219]|uniref:hypothetical protein n=1 Tax=Phormidium sp. CCY1219 TaxID=2886104 RepID=UPI002D1EB3AC|nr:hypothetical protein [Phormidium sp. CCY1219]MEB3829704.1 hypothetical protein [Phormidium sp. CCY1219]